MHNNKPNDTSHTTREPNLSTQNRDGFLARSDAWKVSKVVENFRWYTADTIKRVKNNKTVNYNSAKNKGMFMSLIAAVIMGLQVAIFHHLYENAESVGVEIFVYSFYVLTFCHNLIRKYYSLEIK